MKEFYPSWTPNEDEIQAGNKVIDAYVVGKEILGRSYNQFNGRTLYEAIDDWTKRWNGFIPEASPLLDKEQSRIFVNFTRNQVISYLSKVALQKPEIKVKAVNKKSGTQDYKFADVLKDLNDYSLDEENGEARFLESALEATTKGTAIVYEGYKKNIQRVDVPVSFDIETGKGKFKKEDKITFDNCFQKIIPPEDFYISNPFEPDIQKQPFLIWKEITTHSEASKEFADYKNWKFVRPGSYSTIASANTFYHDIASDLLENQVEILRFFAKEDDGTKYVIMANSVVLYDGPIPFKDGLYPFARGIYEPYDNFFFWGAGFPQKIMGDQDLINTFWNMMVDKTYGSLLPYGLSSDLDDFVEDDILQPNKIRKVGDINKWKFDTLPGINAGEQNMLQQAINFAKDNSGNVEGAGQEFTPRGGKMNVRQILLQQQESMQRLGFGINFLEDMERERTKLRINHILQFYSIPKIEKITGKNGKEIEQLLYRDARLSGVKLSNGKTGEKQIKIIPHPETADERQMIADNLSIEEIKAEINGQQLEVLAVDVDTFYDYNVAVQIVRNSTFEKNAALDQSMRLEYAQWRLGLFQLAPCDAQALIDWVSESYDIDPEQFKPKGTQQPIMGMPQPGTQQLGGGISQQLAPSNTGTLQNNI